jgi:tetratricopeptide (TPR) repeat protein
MTESPASDAIDELVKSLTNSWYPECVRKLVGSASSYAPDEPDRVARSLQAFLEEQRSPQEETCAVQALSSALFYLWSLSGNLGYCEAALSRIRAVLNTNPSAAFRPTILILLLRTKSHLEDALAIHPSNLALLWGVIRGRKALRKVAKIGTPDEFAVCSVWFAETCERQLGLWRMRRGKAGVLILRLMRLFPSFFLLPVIEGEYSEACKTLARLRLAWAMICEERPDKEVIEFCRRMLSDSNSMLGPGDRSALLYQICTSEQRIRALPALLRDADILLDVSKKAGHDILARQCLEALTWKCEALVELGRFIEARQAFEQLAALAFKNGYAKEKLDDLRRRYSRLASEVQ